MQACERRGPDRMDYLNETPSRRRHDSRKRPLAVAVLTISIHNALGDSKMHGVCYMGLGGCSFERQQAEGGHFGQKQSPCPAKKLATTGGTKSRTAAPGTLAKSEG